VYLVEQLQPNSYSKALFQQSLLNSILNHTPKYTPNSYGLLISERIFNPVQRRALYALS
jgi:hypothetical protein